MLLEVILGSFLPSHSMASLRLLAASLSVPFKYVTAGAYEIHVGKIHQPTHGSQGHRGPVVQQRMRRAPDRTLLEQDDYSRMRGREAGNATTGELHLSPQAAKRRGRCRHWLTTAHALEADSRRLSGQLKAFTNTKVDRSVP